MVSLVPLKNNQIEINIEMREQVEMHLPSEYHDNQTGKARPTNQTVKNDHIPQNLKCTIPQNMELRYK